MPKEKITLYLSSDRIYAIKRLQKRKIELDNGTIIDEFPTLSDTIDHIFKLGLIEDERLNFNGGQ